MARAKQILGGVLAVVVTVGVLSLVFVGCDSLFFAGPRATIQTYFRAIGAGDSATACGQLADSGRAKLTAQQRTATCEDAVRNLAASLTATERDELVKAVISVSESAAADSRTEITLDSGDPLGLQVVVLYQRDGHPMITDWGWHAKEIFSD